MADPVVLGPADVWTTGGGSCNTTNLYNWTGSGWTRYTLPYGATPAGSSSAGLWLLTVPVTRTCRPVPGARLTLRRWNGSSFSKAPVPSIADLPRLGTYFVVSSAHDIWVANATESVIMHWNGRRWRRLPKAPQYFGIGQIVPDGHDGTWIGGCVHWTGGTWQYLDAPDACDESFGIARIPGTRSAWRLALARYGGRVEGTIEVNGRLP
jgi:hypothetical protein